MVRDAEDVPSSSESKDPADIAKLRPAQSRKIEDLPNDPEASLFPQCESPRARWPEVFLGSLSCVLERGDVLLAYGDLLPIQQLARMDDDVLRSAANALPTRLAAKLWKARAESSVGDNPWETGGAGISEYVTTSDLRHWIRRKESGIGKTYAKKLVSRVIDAMLDLSTHRVAVRRRT